MTLRVEGGLLLTVQLSSRVAPPEGPGEDELIHIAITNISKLKHTQQVLEDINREHEAIADSNRRCSSCWNSAASGCRRWRSTR